MEFYFHFISEVKEELEFVFPHHRLNWFHCSIDVLRIIFCVVVITYVALYREVDKLAYWHASVNSYWLRTRDFQGPRITVPNVSFSSGGVYINT